MSRRSAAEELCSALATVSTEFIELTDVVNPAVVRVVGDLHHVEPPTPVDRSVITSDSYEALYDSQLAAGSFNYRMLDGALIQLSYTFKAGKIYQHRLAYLPSPRLDLYENDVVNYLEAHPLADIGGPQSVIVPVRFDYDAREGVAIPIHHPVSHCTLGQHSNCRIPVLSALSPRAFLSFVITNFYTLANEEIRETLTTDIAFTTHTIHPDEASILNISYGCQHHSESAGASSAGRSPRNGGSDRVRSSRSNRRGGRK